MVAAAVVAAGALTAGATAMSGSQAAGAQKGAAANATNAQLAMFNTTQGNLSPFQSAGAGANNLLSQLLGFKPQVNGGLQYGQMTDDQKEAALTALRQKYGGNEQQAEAEFSARGAMGGQGFNDLVSGLPGAPIALPNGLSFGQLTQPFQPTEAQLEQTPGYQFTLNQGLKATQNANAARGLGVSGAALRGAADYATGLADSTYNQQFQNYLTQQDAIYNRLAGVAQLGEAAGAGVGGAATQTGASIGSNMIGAGNAQAAATMATAGAIGQGSNNLSNLLMLQSLAKNGSAAGIFSGPGGASVLS